MTPQTRIIDASVRFLRTNPELLAYAQSAAQVTGRSVEQLLRDAVDRVRTELAPTADGRA